MAGSLAPLELMLTHPPTALRPIPGSSVLNVQPWAPQRSHPAPPTLGPAQDCGVKHLGLD